MIKNLLILIFSDSKELQSWIETINFVCGAFSTPALSGAIGNSKRFQRPLLPCSRTKLTFREQFASHEHQIQLLEQSLDEHRQGTVPSKGRGLQNFKEKEAYLCYEIKRYKAYVTAMRNKTSEYENQYSPIVSNSVSGGGGGSGSSGMYDETMIQSSGSFNLSKPNSKRHGEKTNASFSDG